MQNTDHIKFGWEKKDRPKFRVKKKIEQMSFDEAIDVLYRAKHKLLYEDSIYNQGGWHELYRPIMGIANYIDNKIVFENGITGRTYDNTSEKPVEFIDLEDADIANDVDIEEYLDRYFLLKSRPVRNMLDWDFRERKYLSNSTRDLIKLVISLLYLSINHREIYEDREQLRIKHAKKDEGDDLPW